MATPSVLTNAQILVIDDEPDLRTLYELTLLREGYRVETAGSVQDALQLIDAKRFDVVILTCACPTALGSRS
jgi:two-component system response regulator PilR (NtrC family)